MPPKEKRARQKEHRDAIRRSRERELRKRRLVRTVAALLGVLLIALLVVSTIAGGGGDQDTEAGARSEPTPIPDAACDAEAPEAADPPQYDEPERVLERGVDYRAVIHTSCGDITVDLDPKAAPDTVNSFVFLAREGFYDGLTFHRIVGDFVIQGGDPNGDGTGGPGYELPDELPERSNAYVFGALAMANSGPDTSGSQFFFVTHDAPELDSDGNVVTGQDAPEPAGLQPLFSLFGAATEDSYEVLKTIQRVPVEGETPVAPVFINSIDIEER